MNIAVYLGANESGNRLIYGGSKTGLMGLLADSALGAGAEVIGVELEMFMDEDYQHTGLTELIVKPDFPQRKTEIIRRSEAFIAFPGGPGTLEEISEVISRKAIKRLSGPCILYNLDGYYEGLRAQLRHMVEMGLYAPEKLEDIHFAADLAEIKTILAKK